MDSAIQSLVQSPYMRTMASIPSKSEWLVHGVSDHMPPISKQRVVLQPISGSKTSPNTTFRFEIPRIGLLRRMTLRLAVVTPAGVTNTAWNGGRVSYLDYANMVTNIEMYSKQRFLERLAPAAIPWEMASVEKLRDKGYGFQRAIPAGLDADGQLQSGSNALPEGVWSPTASQPIVWTAADKSKHVGFFIPLPFCSMTSLRKNFQTFFTEQLSVEVTTQTLSTNPSASYYVELVCDYHQFHPNVETTIRNANFKQGVPATIPWYDWLLMDRRISSLEVGRSSAIPYEGISYSLESDALISELIIVPKLAEANQPSLLTVTRNYYIVITANGDVLYESSFWDCITHGGKPAVRDEDSAVLFWPVDRFDVTSQGFIPIILGMEKKKEQFTGGLALSSLVNARITIYPNESVYRRSDSTPSLYNQFPNAGKTSAMEFLIYAKRHYLMRIDSDTGVVARTIES